MSKPIRYSIVADFEAPWAKMHEFRSGEWVRWEDYANLKAEVERLRIAGDAMAFNYEQMHDFDGVYDSDLMKLVDRWNAAKEGKSQP